MAPHSTWRVEKAPVGWLGAVEQEDEVMPPFLLSCSLVLSQLFCLPANKASLPKFLGRLV